MGRKYGKLWGGKSASVFKPLGCKQGSWRFKKKLQVIFLFKLLPWAISEALAFRNREPIITGSYV
jgi:hypothetical protein